MITNWDEEELIRWIGTDSQPLKPKSRDYYKVAFRYYSQFRKMGAKQLIDEIDVEYQGSRRQRGRVKAQILSYYNWLQQRITQSSSVTYLGAILGFYHSNNFKIEFERREYPRSKPVTSRKFVSPEDVGRLLGSSLNIRNQAIIMSLYQSGMDISTLLNLNIEDVVNKENRIPSGRVMITTERLKTPDWEYRTFLGVQTMEYVKGYLKTRRQLKLKSPLFLNNYTHPNPYFRSNKRSRRASTTEIQQTFRHLVVRAGFFSKSELKEHYRINPMGTHALRESFGKIATNHKMNQNLIDYFMGHKTPYSGVYSNQSDSELERAYSELEPFLSVDLN